jgi:hypothetical protein
VAQRLLPIDVGRLRRQETTTAELLDLVAGYEATGTPPTVSA